MFIAVPVSIIPGDAFWTVAATGVALTGGLLPGSTAGNIVSSENNRSNRGGCHGGTAAPMEAELEATLATGAGAVTLTLPSERPDTAGTSSGDAWTGSAEEIVWGSDTGGVGAGGASARAGAAPSAAVEEAGPGLEAFRGRDEADRDDESDELVMTST